MVLSPTIYQASVSHSTFPPHYFSYYPSSNRIVELEHTLKSHLVQHTHCLYVCWENRLKDLSDFSKPHRYLPWPLWLGPRFDAFVLCFFIQSSYNPASLILCFHTQLLQHWNSIFTVSLWQVSKIFLHLFNFPNCPISWEKHKNYTTNIFHHYFKERSERVIAYIWGRKLFIEHMLDARHSLGAFTLPHVTFATAPHEGYYYTHFNSRKQRLTLFIRLVQRPYH